MNIKGIIIQESLKSSMLPVQLKMRVTEEYGHDLAGTGKIKILVVHISREELPGVLLELSGSMLPEKFYAHFVAGETIYVVFPSTVCLVHKGDIKSVARCRQIGALFAIPDEQMVFEAMFEVDHPDAS